MSTEQLTLIQSEILSKQNEMMTFHGLRKEVVTVKDIKAVFKKWGVKVKF